MKKDLMKKIVDTVCDTMFISSHNVERVCVVKGNWTDRVDVILYNEGIDKNKITFMNITYSGCTNETTFKIYSRG